MRSLIIAAALVAAPSSTMAFDDDLGTTYMALTSDNFEEIDKMCEDDLQKALDTGDGNHSPLIESFDKLDVPGSLRTIIMRQCSSFGRGAMFGAKL